MEILLAVSCGFYYSIVQLSGFLFRDDSVQVGHGAETMTDIENANDIHMWDPCNVRSGLTVRRGQLRGTGHALRKPKLSRKNAHISKSLYVKTESAVNEILTSVGFEIESLFNELFAGIDRDVGFTQQNLLDLTDKAKVRLVDLLDCALNACKYKLLSQLDMVEQNSKSNNLCVFGIPETERGKISTQALVLAVLNEKLQMHPPLTENLIRRAKRVGKLAAQKENGTYDSASDPHSASHSDTEVCARPILISFVEHKTRANMFYKRTLLKGTPISIREDLTAVRRRLYYKVTQIFGNSNSWIRNGVIHFKYNGKKYSVVTQNQLEELLSELGLSYSPEGFELYSGEGSMAKENHVELDSGAGGVAEEKHVEFDSGAGGMAQENHVESDPVAGSVTQENLVELDSVAGSITEETHIELDSGAGGMTQEKHVELDHGASGMTQENHVESDIVAGSMTQENLVELGSGAGGTVQEKDVELDHGAGGMTQENPVELDSGAGSITEETHIELDSGAGGMTQENHVGLDCGAGSMIKENRAELDSGAVIKTRENRAELDCGAGSMTEENRDPLVHAAIGDLEEHPGLNSTWALTNLGDVFVFSTESLKRQQYSGGVFAADLKCSYPLGSEWRQELNNGLPPGASITVAGFIPKSLDRFYVNLEDNSSGNTVFHINPRFKENLIVRNSKENGSWSKEEKEGLMTLKQGGDFEIRILCLAEGFKVSINGIVFTYFEHRYSPYGITHVRVSKGVELQKVTYESKEVILPLKKMVWKQVGGHMKVVETCSAGVTWGISSDNVPYAYTGGWGGQFLDGLQKSENGIHGLTDHCVLDVWENQRWNPLSGFSSRGLPTDRPMWSDITGFHKRSKETTRLLSKHWQWVTDWSVDFQAPGGVDSEGWQYAMDFSTSYHPFKGMADIVRRRRWIRTCKLTTSGPWLEVGNSKVVDISLQDSTGLDAICVWAVSAKGDALYRKGVTKSNPEGESWEHVACSELLETISCGCSNQVWASTKSGSSYWRFGISTSNPKGEIWEIVEPPKGALIKKVSVARWAVWALDRDGRIYVRREVTPVFPEGTHWQSISQPDFDLFRDVSASGDEVWAITSNGTLVRRLGVSCENPAGSSWLKGLSANWKYVSARSCTSKTMPQKR